MKVVIVGNAVILESTFSLIEDFASIIRIENIDKLVEINELKSEDYCLWIHFDSQLKSDCFKDLLKPKLILTTTTGITHIDEELVREFESNGKLITLFQEYALLDKITSTAEHTWTLLLNIVSKLAFIVKDHQSSKYNRTIFYKEKQISECTIGIIGFGRLGKMSYKYAKAFAKKVIIYDIDRTTYLQENSESLTLAGSIEEIFRDCDIILLHASANSYKKNIITEEILGGITSGKFLVNTARAHLINGPALLQAISDEKVIGYATDVCYGEEINGNSKYDKELYQLQENGFNILITPHVAGGTKSAIKSCEEFLVNKLKIIIQRDALPQ